MAAFQQITQNSPVISPPSVDVRKASPNPGKVVEMPQQPVQGAGKPVTEQEVREAVEQANRELKASSGPTETIGFGYEAKLNQLYVQVKDANTGEVIREIPSKEFIQHRIAMREMIGLLLDKQA